MKTKNNVQKAINKSLAIVASLILISFTVNAQNFWRSILDNATLNEFAVIMSTRNDGANSVSKSKTTDINAFATYLTTETEEDLTLEDWMIDENLFEAPITENSVNLTAKPTINTANQATEDKLKLEKWMLDENNFNVKQENTKGPTTNVFKFINDDQLRLESWMVSSNNWK